MDLDKELILDKTHYGLTIYAYILRQCYPGETVLSLKGRDCKPTKNPFKGDTKTLRIQIVEGCACHLDEKDDLFCGDVFDFAKLYFKVEDKVKLYENINESLNLGIDLNADSKGIGVEPEGIFFKDREEFTPTSFSYFSKPISNVYPSRKIDLLDLYNEIKGSRYIDRTSKLRSITDKREAKKYKAFEFDYVTFSGVFSKRSDKHLSEHTNLLAIDFDDIEDVQALKRKLLNDQYFDTEMLFISPSGNGLKWIIPIDTSKVSHREYFTAVSNYISQTYGIDVDQSGKDISRACFLPHDPKVYLNPKYY